MRRAHARELRLVGDLKASDEEPAFVRRFHDAQILEHQPHVGHVESAEALAHLLSELKSGGSRLRRVAIDIDGQRQMGAPP